MQENLWAVRDALQIEFREIAEAYAKDVAMLSLCEGDSKRQRGGEILYHEFENYLRAWRQKAEANSQAIAESVANSMKVYDEIVENMAKADC
jgi:hypothetical protein